MRTLKDNPKRWYIVMVFAMALSFFGFMVGPRVGYGPEAAHAVGIMIGLWAPVLGVMGLRAELLQKKE